MFSVVIPLYNKEKRVKNTIESVLNQTFQDFEVIVVNDGSTDNSLEVVKSFNDERIRIINQKNSGVSSARNRGIKEAKYEWIAFLDADDLWDHNKLEMVAEVIDKEKNVNWIITGYTLLKNEKRSVKLIYNKNRKLENVIDDLLLGLKIHTSAVIVQKKIFIEDERLFFREGLNNSEDREVWYKLCCSYPNPVYINKSLSYYNIEQGGNNLTNNPNVNFLNMNDRLNDFFRDMEIDDVLKLKKHINKINYNIMLSYWANLNLVPVEFKDHLSPFMYSFLRKTVFYPIILKKIISHII